MTHTKRENDKQLIEDRELQKYFNQKEFSQNT